MNEHPTIRVVVVIERHIGGCCRCGGGGISSIRSGSGRSTFSMKSMKVCTPLGSFGSCNFTTRQGVGPLHSLYTVYTVASQFVFTE
jgi:hypothetical protein